MSLREQYEYQLMEDCLTYDQVERIFRVKYPFTEDPSILTNNFKQVVKIWEREERALSKEGLTEAFNQDIKKMMLLTGHNGHRALVDRDINLDELPEERI